MKFGDDNTFYPYGNRADWPNATDNWAWDSLSIDYFNCAFLRHGSS